MPLDIDQTPLLPPNAQDFVPKSHFSPFIVELVRESLDLEEITGSYASGLGQPPFDPRMMMALLLNGHASETPYRVRKQVVEPVFGQIKQTRGFHQFLLRSGDKVRAEGAMICTTHNPVKLFTLAKVA